MLKGIAEWQEEGFDKKKTEWLGKQPPYFEIEEELLDFDLIRIEFNDQEWRWCKCGDFSLPFELVLESKSRCPKCRQRPTCPEKPTAVNRIAEQYQIKTPLDRECDGQLPTFPGEIVLIDGAKIIDNESNVVTYSNYELLPGDPRHSILFGQFVESAWDTEEWNNIPFSEGGLGDMFIDWFRMIGYSYEDASKLVLSGFKPWE